MVLDDNVTQNMTQKPTSCATRLTMNTTGNTAAAAVTMTVVLVHSALTVALVELLTLAFVLPDAPWEGDAARGVCREISYRLVINLPFFNN